MSVRARHQYEATPRFWTRFASLRSNVATASYRFAVATAAIAASAREGSGSGPWAIVDDADAGEGDDVADHRGQPLAGDGVQALQDVHHFEDDELRKAFY